MKKTVWEIYQPYASGMVAEGLNELKGFAVMVIFSDIHVLLCDPTFVQYYPWLKDDPTLIFNTGREVRDDIENRTWGTGTPLEGMYKEPKHYANRDIIRLDKDGEYYSRHIGAMTKEGLFGKSEIAGELAHRDREIDRLNVILSQLVESIKDKFEGMSELREILEECGMWEDEDTPLEEYASGRMFTCRFEENMK